MRVSSPEEFRYARSGDLAIAYATYRNKRPEAAVAAADLEDAGAVERDECLDPPRLGAVQVRIVHA